jgi:lysophospholipase L1-like esterase
MFPGGLHFPGGLGVPRGSSSGGAAATALPSGAIAFESRTLAGVDGAAVASWPDSSGTYTLVAAAAPTLKVGAAFGSGRGVQFDGVDDDMTQDVDFASTPGEVTIIAAYHQKQTPTSTSAQVGLYTGDNTSFSTKCSLGLSTGTLRINKTSTVSYSAVAGTGITHPFDTTSDTNRAVTTVTRRGTANALDAWMRGVRLITASATATGVTLSRKLRVGNFGASFFKGTMYGIWVWPRGLTGDETTGEVKQALDYIAEQYGVLQDNGTFVCAGDSITDGIGATDPVLDPWPELISNGLIAEGWGHRFRNGGVGGVTAATFVSQIDTASDLTTVHYQGYPGGTRKNVLVIWMGTNDLYNGGTEVGMPTAATVHGYNQTMCSNYRGEGWKVLVITMTPRETHAGFDAARDEFNNLIIANWSTYADAMVDVGNHPPFAKVAGALPVEYFGTDSVHPNTAGYAVIRTLIEPTVRTLLGV